VVQRKLLVFLKNRHPRRGGISCAHAGFHLECSAHDFAGVDDRAGRDRLHRSADQRGRDHEHHAGYGGRRGRGKIGLRKAVGAAPKQILSQFLIEAFLISAGGAVIGILLGLAIPVVVQQLLPGNLRAPVSETSVVLAFLVSCSTGLFFGWLPAKQAASMEPVESLRYE